MDLLTKIEELCAAETSVTRLYETVVDQIFEAEDRYSWVGIYAVEGPDLVLAGWRGPKATQHVRIPLTRGVCGFAATKGETVIVGDVNADPRYLECFDNTKSEIVVPIMNDGQVVAEIDIDSDELAAFGDDDRKTLEQLADVIGKRVVELKK